MSRLRFRKLPGILCCLLLVFLVAGPAFAADSSIPSYDVNIDVHKDGTYDVTEQITMVFGDYDYSHGMYREIPIEPHVYFEQNDQFYSRDYRVRISNVRVNEPYTTFVEDGSFIIRVGEEDAYVNGRTLDYKLSYTYDPGDDGLADFDMFYFGIIGNQWAEPIDGITFRIAMPSDFDPNAVGFSVGWQGDWGYDPEKLVYSVDGSVITGSYLGTLEPYEGIWIRIALPAGYFETDRSLDTPVIVTLYISGILAAAAAGAFLFIRQRKKPVVSVEFGPPDGLNPADVGYVLDETADDRDIIALLIYWASKGYIRIVEIVPKKAGKKPKHLLFVKLTDLPASANNYERDLFDELFRDGVRVSTKDLRYNFYDAMKTAKKGVADKFSEPPLQISTPASRKASNLCMALAGLPAALMAAVSAALDTYEIMAGVVGGVFLYVIGTLLAGFWLDRARHRWTRDAKKRIISGIIWWAVCIAYYAIIVVACASYFYWFGLIPAASGLLLTFIAPHLLRYTDQGLEWTGKVLGLKRFMERAEKNRLEMLTEENPSYFYDVLPYAYALGVSEVWADRFADLTVAPPDWYTGVDSGPFNTVVFTGVLMHSMDRAQSSLTATRSSGGSGGGGGFSGGGFSGGGFGGGGGGRW